MRVTPPTKPPPPRERPGGGASATEAPDAGIGASATAGTDAGTGGGASAARGGSGGATEGTDAVEVLLSDGASEGILVGLISHQFDHRTEVRFD